MRADPLDNAGAREIRSAGRLDIKILRRILFASRGLGGGRRRRERQGKQAPKVRLSKEATAIRGAEDSTDSVRTLSRRVRVRVGALELSFDVRICLLLIKAYSRAGESGEVH
jgi:hypothetical protein